jgi:tetratricopeptide (TPR) repeat protein
VELAPKFATGWSNLGTVQFLQGDPGVAKASFSTAIKLSPNFCAPRIGRSTILANSGYIDNAIADLEVCLQSEPRHLLVNRKLAVLYLQVARLEDAKKVAETLSQDDALLSKTVLADIYLRQNQSREARKQLQSITNPDPQILYLLSFCDMLEGQSKDAIERIRQAEALQPDSATLQIASMVFTFAADRPVDNANQQQLSKDAAIGKLALFLAGNVQAASGNMKKAYDLWTEAEDVLPGFTLDGVSFDQVSKSISSAEQRSLALGMLYYLKNLYPASLSEFNKALAINADSFLANYFSAIANAQVGNKVEAVEHLKRSLKQAPEFFPANYMLAESYLQKRDIDSAIPHYQAAANSKADGGVLIKLGLLYEQKNRQQDAEAAYRKFIENYADNFIGYNQLAWMFTRNGERLDEALKLATKANELQPGNASINDTIGWIYFQKNDYTKAKRHLSLANTISKGNNADILFHLASLEYALGKTENAKALVEKALQTSANFESRSQAQKLLTKLQN